MSNPYDFIDVWTTHLDDIPTLALPAVALTKVKVIAPAHGLQNGDFIRIKFVLGMIELNWGSFSIAEADVNTFVLKDSDGHYINGLGFTPYISGGVIETLIVDVSGLDHAEGEVVGVVADGIYLGPQTVSGGSIPSLPTRAANVQIGFLYKGLIKSMNVDAPVPLGPASAKPKNTNKWGLRVLNTLALKYGTDIYRMEEIDFTNLTDITGRPSPPYSGSLPALSYEDDTDTEKHLYFLQDKPLPCTILNVDPFFDVDVA